MANSEKLEFLMGSELKLIFNVDYQTKLLALSVWQRTEPLEGEEDDWNMLSTVHYTSPHPMKLARLLKELKAIDVNVE